MRLCSKATAGCFFVIAAAALAGCGSSSRRADARRLDESRVAHAIAASILSEHGLHASVSCPGPQPLQARRTFTCMAFFGVGSYPVDVTELAADGRVRYSSERRLAALDIGSVERAIEATAASERRLRIAVSCPSEVIEQAGLRFMCAAKPLGGSRETLFRVTELTNAGRVSYEAL